MPRGKAEKRTDTLAKRVRMAIAEMDPPLKDYETAQKANVGADWLSSVKNGHIKNPPLDKLRALARVTGKDVTFFTEVLEYIPADERGLDWETFVRLVESEPHLRTEEQRRGVLDRFAPHFPKRQAREG